MFIEIIIIYQRNNISIAINRTMMDIADRVFKTNSDPAECIHTGILILIYSCDIDAGVNHIYSKGGGEGCCIYEIELNSL